MLINNILWGLCKGSRRSIFWVSLFSCLGGLTTLLQSFYVSRTIRSIIEKDNSFIYYFLLYLVFILLQLGLRYPTTRLTMNCEANTKQNLREKLLDKVYRVGLLKLNDERSGAIATTILDKVEALAPYYSIYVPNLFMVLFISIGCTIYISTINKSVALLMLFGILMIIIVPFFTYKYLWSTGKEVWKEYENFSSDFLDNIQGMETLKNLNASANKRDDMEKLSKLIHKKTMDNLKITSIENFLFEVFATVGSLLSISYAGYLTAIGEIPVDQLVFIMFAIRSCFIPVYSLMNAWHLGYNGVTASEKIKAVLEENEPQWKSNFIPENNKFLSIKNLSFSYENDIEVIKNMNLELEEGKVNAFVGKSGDGKSTFAAIVAGLYPYTKGEISLKGKPLSQQNIYNWREEIGTVWQGAYIFNMTLKENLLIAKPDATDDEIDRAIKYAKLEQVVEKLPDKMDTNLGEHGLILSGGERQRVSIARCFLKNAQILIFDEATSSLDEQNQSLIQQSIEKLIKGKTAIIIAHRLSTIINADRIFMIKSGEVIASGKHSELMNSCAEYVSLIESQRRAQDEAK